MEYIISIYRYPCQERYVYWDQLYLTAWAKAAWYLRSEYHGVWYKSQRRDNWPCILRNGFTLKALKVPHNPPKYTHCKCFLYFTRALDWQRISFSLLVSGTYQWHKMYMALCACTFYACVRLIMFVLQHVDPCAWTCMCVGVGVFPRPRSCPIVYSNLISTRLHVCMAYPPITAAIQPHWAAVTSQAIYTYYGTRYSTLI